MIVVDASLATKSVLTEADSDAAVAFMAGFAGAMAGPDLLLTEVAAAIVRNANDRRHSQERADHLLAVWQGVWRDGLIEMHRLTPVQLVTAAQLAMGIGHPLADCIYLALAMDLRCPLATCDARFRDKALPTYPQIRLLDELA